MTSDNGQNNVSRAYDRVVKAMEVHAKQIEAFSIAAMRAPALASAGGIAATLGFYSANYSRLAAASESIGTLRVILFWFFLAAFLAVLAPGAAYFSQLLYQDSLSRETYEAESEFTVETAASKRSKQIGDIFRWLTVLITASSIVCFAIGGLRFLTVI
jgi:ABC-type Na+ efflux pump permease subunit